MANQGLLEAARKGDLDELKRLLACGADKDAKGSSGGTPVHRAAGRGRLTCLQELLARGSDKDAKDEDGETPLHWAARHRHLDCLKELLAWGSDKDAADAMGYTPLHLVARNGHVEGIRELLAAGCDKEARGNDGSTPLHLAASNNEVKCVRELLAAGCDKEAQDNRGDTPFDQSRKDWCKACLATQVHCTLLASTSLVADEDARRQLEVACAAFRACIATHRHPDNTSISLVLFGDSEAEIQLDHRQAGELRGFTPGPGRLATSCTKSSFAWRTCTSLLRKSSKFAYEYILLFTSTPLEPPADYDIHKMLQEHGSRLGVVVGISVGTAEGASTGLPLRLLRDAGVEARVLAAGSEEVLLEAVSVAAADVEVHRGRGGICRLYVNQISGERIAEADRQGLRSIADLQGKVKGAVREHLKSVGKVPEEWSWKLVLGDASTPADSFEVASIPLSAALTLVLFDEIKAHVDASDLPEGQKRMLDRHLRLILGHFNELPDHLRRELDEDAIVLLRLLFQLPSRILAAFLTKPDVAVQVLKTVPANSVDAFRRDPLTFIREHLEEEGVQVEQCAGTEEAAGDDLSDPNGLVDFLIDADIRLVRLEYLVELLESGRALPRRQEAEQESIKLGASALVTATELQQVEINCETFHVSIMLSHPAPRRVTVHFVSVSHVWESMQHPDPWRFQLQSVVDKHRSRLVDSVVWVFFDFLSLYQYDRDQDQDRVFRQALKGMHLLYSHEAVEVQRIEVLTPKELQDDCLATNGSRIPVYWEDAKKVTDVSISQLKMNRTPYSLRGWCQAERQWAALRASIKGEFPVPLPPQIFRDRMRQLLFTHREDSHIVFELQEKIFRQKAATTTRLLAEGLDTEKIADLAAALPFYSKLTEVVLMDIPENTAWKVTAAAVQSGACDVQIECDEFSDEDAAKLSAALLAAESQPLDRLHLRCNRLGESCRKTLEQMMKHRRTFSKASYDLVIEGRVRKEGHGGDASEQGQPEQTSSTLRILVHKRVLEVARLTEQANPVLLTAPRDTGKRDKAVRLRLTTTSKYILEARFTASDGPFRLLKNHESELRGLEGVS
ncbi:ANKRD44 [Symbiodinium sp. CCMP2592]|nr:ANKRD44 [Symbiodinium sp. CCMP2592]